MKYLVTVIFALAISASALSIQATPVTAAPTTQSATATPSAQPTAQEEVTKGIQLYEQGKWAEALSALERAQKLAQELNDAENEGLAWLYIGRAQIELEDPVNALAALETSTRIWEQQKNSQKLLETLQLVGDLYSVDKKYEQALSAYTTALNLAKALETSEIENTLTLQVADAQFEYDLNTYLAELAQQRLTGNQAKIAATLNKLGDLYRLRDLHDQALAAYEEELGIRRELQDDEKIAAALEGIGKSYRAQKQYPEAVTTYQEILAIWQRLENAQEEASALNALGTLHLLLQQYAEARTMLEAELALRQTAQAALKEAEVYSQLNLAYQGLQQYDLAQDALEKEISIWQANANLEKQTLAQIELGQLFDDQQQYALAIEQYTVVLSNTQPVEGQTTITETVISPEEVIRVVNYLADDYYALQQFDKALPYYERALFAWQEANDAKNQLKTLRRMGELQAAGASYDAALQSFEAALLIAEANQDLSTAGKLYEDMANIHELRQQWPASLNAYQTALTIWQQLGETEQMLKAMVKIGNFYYRHSKEYDQALQIFQTALGVAQNVNDQEREADLFQRIADTYDKKREYALALENYQQALTLWQALNDAEELQKINLDIADTQAALQEQQLEARTESGIVQPLDGATVSGIVEIRGIANDPAFQKWQLDLLIDQNPDQATFLELGRRIAPKAKQLVDLDTTQFPNGTHTLRLRVVRTDFNYDEYLVVITIAN